MIETADDPIPILTREMDDTWITRRTPMAQTSDDQLRSLIRLLPPARALRDDLERSIHLETFMGTGDMAVRSFQGLQASVARIIDDPYVATLSLSVPEGANDQEKVSLVRLAAGQLVAYLEGQTGLAGSEGGGYGSGNKGGNINIQKAPMVTFSAITGVDSEALKKMVEMGAEALKHRGEEEGEAAGPA
jgi:hypothetical protein